MKKFFLVGALALASYVAEAQNGNHIAYFDRDGNAHGTEGFYIQSGAPGGGLVTTFSSFTNRNVSEVDFIVKRNADVRGAMYARGTFISDRLATFKDHIIANRNIHIHGELHANASVFGGPAKFNKRARFNEKAIFTKGFSVTNGNVNIISDNYVTSQKGSHNIVFDFNDTGSDFNSFAILQGSRQKKIFGAYKNKVLIGVNLDAKNINAKDIVANKVTLNVGSFPDYVFSKDYNLMPLQEVATYIKKHKHLPNMPSEAEVVANGMDIKQINTVLVEKVEELTLHTIKQEEKINTLLKELEAIKKALAVNQK